ncbi:MAG: hypothetical protein GY944_06040 [bacterium]|nr:hypothetical protein [bacterium]
MIASCCVSFGLACLVSTPALAQTLDTVSLSPDITVDLDEAGGGTFADEDVAIDDLAGVVVAEDLGTLPEATEVTAYELLGSGNRLFCVATTVELSTTLYAQQGDVVRYDGSVYTLEFDASANGVPNAAQCDAVTVDSSGDLWISFDITVALPDGVGGEITADDEDAVRVDGASAFTLTDATLFGVPGELDLDGMHLLANGDSVGSFDTSGEIDSVFFDDEDVMMLDVSSLTWSLLVDASAQDADWEPADAVAVSVPEPGLVAQLCLGVASLALLARRRMRSVQS